MNKQNTNNNSENSQYKSPRIGLLKVSGKGAHNTCAPRKPKTKVVVMPNGSEYVGKAAKRALFVLGCQDTWSKNTARGSGKGATSCGEQKPYSLKCR